MYHLTRSQPIWKFSKASVWALHSTHSDHSSPISLLAMTTLLAAIGGAVAAMNGAAFLCYVTPAEHLALPNVEDVKQGIIASKIAAHAADIAKGIPGARDIDDKMADARQKSRLGSTSIACALDPDTARAIRDSRTSGG